MSNVLLAPGTVHVRFALDPVYNNLASLYNLHFVDTHPELDEWVVRTVASLSAAQMRTNQLLFEILYSAFEPDQEWPSFPAYLDRLAEQDPFRLRDRFLQHMFPESGESYAHHDRWMDLQTFIAQIDRSEFDHEFEHDLFAEAHALLSDPPAMRDAILAHLTMMWYTALAAEWESNRGFLEQVVDAFQDHGHRGAKAGRQSAYEAIHAVTGRDVHGCWRDVLARAETLIFIPSPHIGPYLMHYAYPPVVRIIFGAHLPPEVKRTPTEPARTDVLVQLRALADETRLRILELLFEQGELCAQEIATRLSLSKSSASRHLSQLSATGFLVEHRRSGKTKCYTLNPQCFQETVRALERYART